MERRRIDIIQLHLHTPLPYDIFNDSGERLLSRGFMLDDVQVARLRHMKLFVNADEFTQNTRPAGISSPASSTSANAESAQQHGPFWLWQEGILELGRVLRAWDKRIDFVGSITKLATHIQHLNDRNPDAALAAIFLLDKTKYPVLHCMHVAVLADLISRRLEWSGERRRSLTCAALTMNISMLELQAVLTLQNIPPTTDQRASIDEHPEVAVNMLMQAGVSDEMWLRAVREHHEAPDGSGYPKHLKEMCEEAVLLRTIDIYTALLSPRATRKAMELQPAAKLTFVEENGHGNSFAGLLIKELGLYPPGSFVKLANGETAVVVKRGATAQAPLAYSMSSGKGIPYLEPLRRDTSLPEFGIAAVVPREKVMITVDLRKMWGTPARL